MATAERFEELDVWQRAKEITSAIYALSRDGSFARDFALRDQMRRAAISIMSNIAEGFESRTQALFIEFLGRAKGSAGELRCQLYIAHECEYIDQQQFTHIMHQSEICSRQIASLMRYLESQPNARRVKEDRGIYDF